MDWRQISPVELYSRLNGIIKIMGADKIRISETGVTGVAPITVYENSKDIAFLDPKKYRSVAGVVLSQYSSSDLLDGSTDYINTGDDESNDKINDVPQLEDIQIITNEAYIDSKGITRARLVIRVRNSSGRNLLGVDARKVIKTNEGGSW